MKEHNCIPEKVFGKNGIIEDLARGEWDQEKWTSVRTAADAYSKNFENTPFVAKDLFVPLYNVYVAAARSSANVPGEVTSYIYDKFVEWEDTAWSNSIAFQHKPDPVSKEDTKLMKLLEKAGIGKTHESKQD